MKRRQSQKQNELEMIELSDTDRMISFFNKLAPDWDDDDETFTIREEIIRRSCILPHSTIGDIGCGKGVMVPHLLKLAPKQLIEIDLSNEMIRLGKKRWNDPRLLHLCGDILTMPLPVLDTAVVFNAYPHLMDKKALASRLSCALRHEGTVIIAHSRSREFINAIHQDSPPCEKLSVPLKSPLEEYLHFEPWFQLKDWEDSQKLYYMKLLRK